MTEFDINNYTNILTDNTMILFVMLDVCGISNSFTEKPIQLINLFNSLLAPYKREDIVHGIKKIIEFGFTRLTYRLIKWVMATFFTALPCDTKLNNSKLFATLTDFKISSELVGESETINRKMINFALKYKDKLPPLGYQFLFMRSDRKRILNERLEISDYSNFENQYKSGALDSFISIIERFKKYF